MVVAYIGLGSNLDLPRRQVERALAELARLDGAHLDGHSSLYRSQPVGPQDQPDFINAVARLSTTLEAEILLDALQALEQSHHRIRGERWGPRSLDLDLLLYGDQIIKTHRLKVPHPEIARRSFVLLPLKEIAPEDLYIPGVGTLQDIKIEEGEGEVERLT
ncbi:MAG: 2-amino-4-hydroxy-6-hydroxymethyldihydropteridine diphosphokinase [Candidatus Thiodiazotropha sp. 6PLUC9]